MLEKNDFHKDAQIALILLQTEGSTPGSLIITFPLINTFKSLVDINKLCK